MADSSEDELSVPDEEELDDEEPVEDSDEDDLSEDEVNDEGMVGPQFNNPSVETAIFRTAEDRTSRSALSLTEAAALAAMRAEQISATGETYLQTDTKGMSAAQMAWEEIKQRRCPLKVHRCVGYSGDTPVYDVFDPKEMDLVGIP